MTEANELNNDIKTFVERAELKYKLWLLETKEKFKKWLKENEEGKGSE